MTQFDRLKAACEKARDVRQAQKDYFRTRGQDALTKSKKLERELDALLPDALRDDDMLEMMGQPCLVRELPPAKENVGKEFMVTDCVHMLVKGIVVGTGAPGRRAKAKSDGESWRVTEWLDQAK